MNPPPQTVSRLEAAGVWLRIGLLSFGGPAGQMILMHKEIVEKRRWVDEDRYLHALNYCVLLPGPEAQQLATYLGWLLHGVGGGLVAGVLFVLPGALLMLVLSALYATLHDASVVVGLFFGVKAAVLAIVTQALIRVGKRALKGPYSLVIAASSLLGLALVALPFPAVVFGSGVVGACVARWRPAWLGPQAVPLSPGPVLAHTLASPRRFVVTLLVGLALWAAPVLLALLLLGAGNVLVVEGVFFSQAAVLTFGGAYAVLAYVGQRAVGPAARWRSLHPHPQVPGPRSLSRPHDWSTSTTATCLLGPPTCPASRRRSSKRTVSPSSRSSVSTASSRATALRTADCGLRHDLPNYQQV